MYLSSGLAAATCTWNCHWSKWSNFQYENAQIYEIVTKSWISKHYSYDWTGNYFKIVSTFNWIQVAAASSICMRQMRITGIFSILTTLKAQSPRFSNTKSLTVLGLNFYQPNSIKCSWINYIPIIIPDNFLYADSYKIMNIRALFIWLGWAVQDILWYKVL